MVATGGGVVKDEGDRSPLFSLLFSDNPCIEEGEEGGGVVII